MVHWVAEWDTTEVTNTHTHTHTRPFQEESCNILHQMYWEARPLIFPQITQSFTAVILC